MVLKFTLYSKFAQVYKPGGLGAARPQTWAKAKFFGQKPAAKNGKKLCIY